jgi:aryl sulfotransferase
MLDSDLLSHDDIDRLRARVYETIGMEPEAQRWIKVHDAYTMTPDGEPLFGRNTARAAIYLVRDPRDVAISLSYHSTTTIDEAIKFMNATDGALCAGRKSLPPQLRQKLTGWSGHVTSWLDQADVPVHPVRYEDLIADPAACFGAALRFAGRAATTAEIERAIRFADLAEHEKGFAERMSRTAPFFRSGRVGGWRESLTSEQVDAIEQAHGAVMARLGYDVTSFSG